MIDIHLNHHVGGKTVLAICDGLYGNYQHLWGVPPRWPQFDNDAPSTIVLGTDPVAVDCVCHDILYREGNIDHRSDDYLVLAGNLGLGVFEHESAPGEYALIDFRYLEPPFDQTGADGPQGQTAAVDMLAVTSSPSSEPTLRLHLPVQFDGRASLAIYGTRGQLVRTLLDNARIRGESHLEWDGTDNSGRRAASGVYWCRLDYEGLVETEKLLLLR
jgi:hypothetical protein